MVKQVLVLVCFVSASLLASQDLDDSEKLTLRSHFAQDNLRGYLSPCCLDVNVKDAALELMVHSSKGGTAKVYYEGLGSGNAILHAKGRQQLINTLGVINIVLVTFANIWQALSFSKDENNISFVPKITADIVLQVTLGAVFFTGGILIWINKGELPEQKNAYTRV